MATKSIKITNEPEILSFKSAKEWRTWLTKNFEKPEGVWLKLYKKKADVKSVTHQEALDEALCFGWIDSKAKSLDEISWILKFTPRRPKSVWSVINKNNIARLIELKKMHPQGLSEVEKAKADGRWDAAYDSPKNTEVPADFIESLKKDKAAYEFFLSLNKTNTYAIAWRLQTAKSPNIREKRKLKLIEMMKNKEKLH